MGGVRTGRSRGKNPPLCSIPLSFCSIADNLSLKLFLRDQKQKQIPSKVPLTTSDKSLSKMPELSMEMKAPR
jgi:hypothetical protein